MNSIGALFESYRPPQMTKRKYAIDKLHVTPSNYHLWTHQPDILPNLLRLFEIGDRVGISEEEIREVYEQVRKRKTA